MAKIHDYTQMTWGEDAWLEAPFSDFHAELSAQGPIAVGDEIVLCLRCQVNDVSTSIEQPEHWKANISFTAPISSADLSDPVKQQLLHQLVSQLGATIQQSELYQQLERSLAVDPVTQVALRARFDGRFKQEWQRMQGYQTPLALILCEVDQLQPYTETYGENARDECLKQVARAVSSSARRAGDLVARFQENTFGILLPNTSLDAAICVAKKMRWRVKALRIAAQPNQPHYAFTMSFGIASMVPVPSFKPENLVAGAEESLRQAQNSGNDSMVWQEGNA